MGHRNQHFAYGILEVQKMIPEDKLYHAAAGAAIGLLCLWSPTASAVTVLLAALGKEAYDLRSKTWTPEFMDIFATLVGWALVAVCLIPLSARAAEIHLDYRAAVAVPKHDPILGKYIERYNLSLTPSLESKYFRYSLELAAHGGVNWIADVSGDPLQWGDSDWSVDAWRYTLTHKAHIGPEYLGVETEFYMPVDRGNWGGHGRETEYYWLLGVGGQLF